MTVKAPNDQIGWVHQPIGSRGVSFAKREGALLFSMSDPDWLFAGIGNALERSDLPIPADVAGFILGLAAQGVQTIPQRVELGSPEEAQNQVEMAVALLLEDVRVLNPDAEVVTLGDVWSAFGDFCERHKWVPWPFC